MRYMIIVFPFSAGKPVVTDFRLVAYCVAFFRSFMYSEVSVFDNDSGRYLLRIIRAKDNWQDSLYPN